jgi:hypothetical protein
VEGGPLDEDVIMLSYVHVNCDTFLHIEVWVWSSCGVAFEFGSSGRSQSDQR